jgi:hypothetical protein
MSNRRSKLAISICTQLRIMLRYCRRSNQKLKHAHGTKLSKSRSVVQIENLKQHIEQDSPTKFMKRSNRKFKWRDRCEMVCVCAGVFWDPCSWYRIKVKFGDSELELQVQIPLVTRTFEIILEDFSSKPIYLLRRRPMTRLTCSFLSNYQFIMALQFT